MITVLMFLGAIAFFISIMFAPSRRTRIIAGLITGIIFVGSTVLITTNFHDHFGMKKVTTTKTTQIYSASSQLPIILYQPIGTSGKDDVYVYRTNDDSAKTTHTQTDGYTTNRVVKTNDTKATLTTKETHWRFKNKFYRLLFAGSKMDGNLISRTNTLRYPKNYVKLTVKQAELLKKQMKSSNAAAQTALKQQAEAFVKAQLQSALQKNPQLSTTQQLEIAQQAQQQFQTQLIKKMLAQAN
ncbi:DUF4811 domain-containing protein [Limosilactobacillus mucosae]